MTWLDGKSSSEEANEAGQEDGSTGDGYGYNGFAYDGDDLDAYNAGYENGRDNPAPDDD
jgi:hypothetical protein